MTATTQSQALSPQQLHSRWLVGGLLLLSLVGSFSVGWLVLVGCARSSYLGEIGIFIVFSSGLVFAALGNLIVFYRPDNHIGWLCLWIGIGLPVRTALNVYASCGLAGHLAAPGQAYVAWFDYSFDAFFLIVPMFILLPLLYPTGRFLSPRWRWVTVTGLIILVVARLAMGLLPDLSQDNAFETLYPVANPFGLASLPAWWYSVFRTISNLGVIALSLVAIASMIVRLKRATGDERQQMKWLAYFLATAVVFQLLVFELPGAFFYPQLFETIWYQLIILVVFLGFPLIIGLAIFKYRLYAIDLIIRRTLAYGLLSAILAVTFLVSVVVLQSLFRTATGQQSAVVIVISTLFIAALFNPLRLRVQGWIDRRFFRRKYDAEQVLAQFAQTARDETDLDRLTSELVRVVQETMQPESVSVWLKKSPK